MASCAHCAHAATILVRVCCALPQLCQAQVVETVATVLERQHMAALNVLPGLSLLMVNS